MAKELAKRSEIRTEDTWALEDIYPSLADWEADLARAEALAEEITSRRQQMTKDARALLVCLDQYQECRQRLAKAFAYACRAADVDTRNNDNQAYQQKITSLRVQLQSRLAFLEPEVLTISEELWQQYKEEAPGLSLYDLWFAQLRRKKEHMLSPQLEELLVSSGEVCQTPSQVFAMFNNADVQFPEVTDETGEQVRITVGRYVPLQCSSDRRVRKEAFEKFFTTYGTLENTLAAVYSGQVKQQIFQARARSYASTLEAAVDANDVSPKVYDNLVNVVNENLDKLHRYMRLRKKCLGLSELHMYDLYVPIVAEADRRVPFAEAKETVQKALAPLGERYGAIVAEGFANRWIDVWENQGKRTGAYAAGVYGVHPYVLLNYNENLDSMFTLAHEMGHALHFYFSNQAQPFVYSNYKIFVAEVASTCNEVLLVEYLLAHTKEPKERAYLINHFLENFRQTLYRQTMFAEYEQITNQMAERGESLTAEALKRVYYDLNCKYYGPDVVADEEIAWEWCRIPHFYYNFYVYQYATGFSAAVAIARRILEEGQPALEKYLQFLSGGCSAAPVELLKLAGVDLSTKEPIQAALDVFGDLIGELEQLMEA